MEISALPNLCMFHALAVIVMQKINYTMSDLVLLIRVETTAAAF